MWVGDSSARACETRLQYSVIENGEEVGGKQDLDALHELAPPALGPHRDSPHLVGGVGFRVWGLGLGFRVWGVGLGFRVGGLGSGFRVRGLVSGVPRIC